MTEMTFNTTGRSTATLLVGNGSPGLAGVLTLCAALLSGGCIGLFRRYARNIPLSAQATAVDVPIVEQEERNDCGLSAVSMVAKYYGRPIAPADRALLLSDARSDGASARRVREVFERNGYAAFVFKGELLADSSARGVLHHLKRGRPVIVAISKNGKRHHYVVVSGYDPTKELVVIEDPRKGHVMCPVRVFEKMWGRSGFLTLLAVPKSAVSPKAHMGKEL